jgi:hypothetical protein
MRETPFQNPRGGYFTMDDRGKLVAEKQHNPNNVHIGERYYGRQGPIGNPRLAGVDFGNRRPMYDKNGKLIQQRPVLKDTSTVPVPIMDYVGSRTAMNRGMDNWGRGNPNYDGTFRVPGYGDPNSSDPWGQDWNYKDDYHDIDILDPGFSDFGQGPLYFG